MEYIIKILSSHKIRPSHHRICVLKYLIQNKTHPTVEDILTGLAPVMPTISRATIYNTLHVLQEAGLVMALHESGSETRFDYRYRNHAHFHCIQCGRYIDVNTEYDCFNTRAIGPHSVNEVLVYFRGVCADCASGKKSEKTNKDKKTKKGGSES